MANQSPFALATVTAPLASSQNSFASNWYVSGIARFGDDDFVTVKSRDAAVQFSLFGREPNSEHGVSVASVQWSETLGKSTVILQKGREMAKLEFNEAEVRAPAATATAATPNAKGAPAPRRLPLPMGGKPSGTTAPPPVVTPNASVRQFSANHNSRPIEPRRRERIIPRPR
jgi:hypothetical protein